MLVRMHANTNLTDAVKKQIKKTTLVVVIIAVVFLGLTALLVFGPEKGSVEAKTYAVGLGVLAILMGGLKEIARIRERQIRVYTDGLSINPKAAGIKELRASERLAGDVADAGSLYLWIFGIGTIFSAWLNLF